MSRSTAPDRPATRPPEPHLLAIDLVRFACALMVLTYHIATDFALATDGAVQSFDTEVALPRGGAGWTWFGWVGVELFFVVSGYVIARSAAGATPGDFVRRRVLRLAPAAWICGSVSALVLLAASTIPATTVAARWLTAMLMVPTPDPIDGSWWTLFIEIAFYAVVATTLRGGGGATRIERLGLLLGLASCLYWIAVNAAGIAPEAAVGSFAVNLTLLPHGVFFAIGILLCRADARGWTAWLVLLGIVLVGGASLELRMQVARFDGVPGVAASIVPPLCVLLAGLAAVAGARWLQRWLTAGVAIRTLGAATYPLYLIHQVVGAALVVALTRAGVGGPVTMTAVAAAMIVLGWGIATHAEPRVRRWMAQAISRRHVPRRDNPPIASLPAG